MLLHFIIFALKVSFWICRIISKIRGTCSTS